MLQAHHFSWETACVRDVETQKDGQLPATVEMCEISRMPFPVLCRENSKSSFVLEFMCLHVSITLEFSLVLPTV